jgi:PBSX family phage portal protein
MTVPLDPYVDVAFYYKGEVMTRKKRFRKYRQDVNGKYVYFKEFGDPRVMDMRTGEYVKDGDLEINLRANEVIALPIGDKPYGEVRWIGQVTGMDGAAKAEALNANYFENGRHTPMMIMIEGGTLTDESFKKMQEYMEGIKGEAGQHAFMVLESETTTEVKTGLEQENAPKITVKDLSPMLQKDELFQGYIDNARKKVQSSFLLPDLYVGYTTDFNRATSQTAMEVTEKQVFIPYRQEMAWIINRKLLAEYQFKYCEISFRAPDITNPDDQSKILNIVERAGGLTPNEAHRLAGTMVGDTAEDFTGNWADIPLAVQKVINDNAGHQAAQTPAAPATPPTPEVMEQVDEKVSEAEQTGNDELIAVMRQVRKALVELADDKKAAASSAFAPISTPTERSMAKAEKKSLGREPEAGTVKASMRQFMMTPKKRGDNSDA